MFNRFWSRINDAIEDVVNFLRGGNVAPPDVEDGTPTPADPFIEDWTDPDDYRHELIDEWDEVQQYLEDSEPAEQAQGLGYLIDEVPDQFEPRTNIFVTSGEAEEYIAGWGEGLTFIYTDEDGFYRIAVAVTSGPAEE